MLSLKLGKGKKIREFAEKSRFHVRGRAKVSSAQGAQPKRF